MGRQRLVVHGEVGYTSFWASQWVWALCWWWLGGEGGDWDKAALVMKYAVGQSVCALGTQC